MDQHNTALAVLDYVNQPMGASSDLRWQHSMFATDSLVEQGLEVEQTAPCRCGNAAEEVSGATTRGNEARMLGQPRVRADAAKEGKASRVNRLEERPVVFRH